MTEGEVAIRRNGHTHAVQAPGLDGAITVNLDHDSPKTVISVPSDVGVVYEDAEVAPASDEKIRADGGAVARTEVEMRGFGLDDESAMFAMVGGALALAASGYVWAMNFPGTEIVALFAFLVAAAIGYVGAQSYGQHS